jgi:hypothetical protein
VSAEGEIQYDRGFVLTLDELVIFAQQGWFYPLRDSEKTRAAIVRCVEEIQRGEITLD